MADRGRRPTVDDEPLRPGLRHQAGTRSRGPRRSRSTTDVCLNIVVPFRGVLFAARFTSVRNFSSFDATEANRHGVLRLVIARKRRYVRSIPAPIRAVGQSGYLVYSLDAAISSVR